MKERVIQLALSQGGDDRPSLRQLSRALGLSERSLQRRLRMEGTTFRAVLDSVRLQLAARALATQGTAVQAADATGFSDPATFRRAFKRWTGMTPKQFSARSSTCTLDDLAAP